MRFPSPRRGRLGLATLAALALLALPPEGGAWGFAAHRMVNGKAVGTLPPPLRSLFEGNASYLVEHSIDPDLWRAAGKPDEGPNHYLEMDAFGEPPFEAIPLLEAEHLARHGPRAAAKGRVPWRVLEVYRELVAAFRAGDEAKVLERAAVLGHYVGDAHVPLHAVIDHDGKIAGQAGLHDRWERHLFERFERQVNAEVVAAAAIRVDDPVRLVFAALRQSYAGAIEVLASDRASLAGGDPAAAEDGRYGDAYYSRFYALEGQRLRARLGESATALGSLWLSAWEDAGRPELDWGFRFPYVRRQTRAVLVSLDGAAETVLDDAVARGVMPNLARLRRAGATARGVVTSLPAKTAAGHATLFTGTWPDRHGITGNNVPRPGASVLESAYGFRSDVLRAEPIWVTAARQGLDVTTISTTQSYPFSPCLDERRFGGNYGQNLTLIDGYQGHEVPEGVLTAQELKTRPASGWSGELAMAGPAREFRIMLGSAHVEGLLYDDPSDPVLGFDTLYLAATKDLGSGIRLKPKSVAPGTEGFAGLPLPTPGGEVVVHFRLFGLSPDGSQLLLYHSSAGVLNASRASVAAAALKAVGGFTGNGANHPYERGAFGPPLWQGGDGTAEERYLETVRLVVRQFGRLLEFCARRTHWDLLVAYLPYPDEALHSWFGYLDPGLSGHDPALAARLRPYLDRVLRLTDDYLGQLPELVGDTLTALVADHGMTGVNRRVCLNAALEKAGLLATYADGSIDLTRTRAVYFPWNAGYFLLNRVSRKGGIVRPEEEGEVMATLKATLRALKDPETGRALVTEVIDPGNPSHPGLGGPQGGDLYFSLASGYFPSEKSRGVLVMKTPPAGEHLLDPERPDMLASLVLAGPGVASGTDLGLIREIDIVPTLSALMGIDPPAQSTGTVLARALARRPSERPTPGASH